MDSNKKQRARQQLANRLKEIIAANKTSKKSGQVSSLRQLAASSGVEYAIIQKISSGQKDPQFTTLVSIAEGLNMELHEFLSGLGEIE